MTFLKLSTFFGMGVFPTQHASETRKLVVPFITIKLDIILFPQEVEKIILKIFIIFLNIGRLLQVSKYVHIYIYALVSEVV